VHEMSHLIACLATRTHVRKVEFFDPRQDAPGKLTLGYVEHDKARNPFFAALIGAAPFFGGSAVLYLLFRIFIGGQFQASTLALSLPSATTTSISAAILSTAASYVAFVRALASSLHWNSWTTYVFLYFTVAVASHVAPSKPDLKHTFLGLGILTAVVGVAVLVTRLLGVSVPDSYTGWLSRPAVVVSALLGCGIVGAGALTLIILAIELIAASVRRARQP